ncbi:MAG: LysR substrate-binding domain-containing protein [Xenococcaceae cyanobacterium MO_207.B15]|nr:LysR substrate-binding domain-containing protein [Xenococcaceae cyanobacterium MO_207.B15]
MMKLHQFKIELQDLEYFIAVAEERNFSRAAERLYIPQPYLSNKIKALEKKVDVQLLNRKKRPLELTQAGQVFFKEACSILVQLKQTIELTQKMGRGEVGCLNIGFTSSIANSVLPDILNAFRIDFSKVELNCRQMASDLQIQGLREGQIDVGFFHPNHESRNYKDMDFMTILEEPLVVVLPENHPLKAESKIPLQVLAGENFVLPTRQLFSGLSEQINLLFNKAGFVPQITQEATVMVTILGLVAGGMGIPAFLTKSAIFFENAKLSPRTETLLYLGLTLGFIDAVKGQCVVRVPVYIRIN